jgi:transposase
MNASAQSILSAPTYEQLLEENDLLQRQNKELAEDKTQLEHLIRLLKRLRFAPKTEVQGKGQGTLFNEAETLTADDIDDVAEDADDDAKNKGKDEPKPKPENRGKPVRKALPEDLPRIDTVVDLPDSEKVCPVTGLALKKIGEEVTEQLDVKPAVAVVLRTIRPKYAPCDCDDCQARRDDPKKSAEPVVKIMPLPPQPIPKSFASPGLLATIATAKYGDGLPLYRQEEIFGRIGVDLTRQTIAGWMVRCGEIVKPLINLAKDELMNGPVILCDETRVQVLKGTGKKPTAKNYMWCFASGSDRAENIVLFELGPGRGHDAPMRFLEGYEGYLHTDGYEAYETLAAKCPKIILVGDWVHARRKFDEAIKAFPKDFKGEIKIKTGFDLINEIFRIDRDEISPTATNEERHRIRQEKSRPLINQLKAWADDMLPTMRPKSLSGIALRYMLNRWAKLVLFLEVPILGLDTNDVENAIRPFVMGRKAWLFSATVAGAEASAALYSLISMARAHGHNIYEYLKAVFTELPRAKTADDVDALLAWNWNPATAG